MAPPTFILVRRLFLHVIYSNYLKLHDMAFVMLLGCLGWCRMYFMDGAFIDARAGSSIVGAVFSPRDLDGIF
jgi:hypothetical protein